MRKHPEIPRIGQIVRHALPRIMEATVVPSVVFLIGHALFGLAGGLAGALLWSWGCIGWRRATRRPVGGLLPIGAMSLLVRSGLALVSGSTFIYFAGPAVLTSIVGLGFVASAATDRPVVTRIVSDVMPLSPERLANPGTDRLLRRLSVLWGVQQVISGAINFWMYRHLPLGRYLVMRGPVGWSLALTALAISLAAGRRHLRRSHAALPLPAEAPEPVAGPPVPAVPAVPVL